MRTTYYFKPMPRWQRIVIYFFVSALMIFAAVSIVLYQLRPIMVKLAVSEVNEVVMKDINDVISEEISSGSIVYSNLIKLEKDINGNITALETNMPMINLLQAQISKGVVSRIENAIISDLEIPIGNAIGGELFSGRGPSFIVKILSVTSVHTSFSNSFSEAGINQTRHKIMLDISVDVDVFVPGTKRTTTVITTQVEVAETIIVGKVPNVYADIGGVN